eukprot:TRINITY_DN3319_c1_g1_i14.p1 TRINITY_DN3319_c1_g1~~TRINITY_DN3319_c1_g1_i14.p1  ORF type:complete len:223 (-),score=48.09 TRINITY_DN3319_c1_g1_i14:24-692(-)
MSSEQDPFVLTYEDVSLRRSDVSLLQPYQWLNDAILSFVFMHTTNTELTKNDEVLLVSPATVMMMSFLNDVQECAIALEPLDLASRQVIVIPVNNNQSIEKMGGSHWAVMVFKRDDNVFEYYDSMNGSNLRSAQRIAKKVIPFLGVDEDQGVSVVEMESPQQQNSYDCGMFVIGVTLYIVQEYLGKVKESMGEGGLLGVITQQWVTAKRKELIQLIDDLAEK